MGSLLRKLCAVIGPACAWLAAAWVGVPGAGAQSSAAPESGWVVVDAGASAPRPNNPAISSPRFALLHLPPRRGAIKTEREGAERGTVRIAAWLGTPPLAMASNGNRVYMVFSPVGGGGGGSDWGPRPVLSVAAEDVGGTWRNEPEGRLEALPSLPGDGELLGLGATRRGPVAVMRDRVSGAGKVLKASGLAWKPIAGPWDGPVAGDAILQVFAANGPGGAAVGILERPGGTAEASVIWEGTEKNDGSDAGELVWTRRVVDLRGLADEREPWTLARRGGAWQAGIVSADGVRIAVDRRAEGGLRLWSIGQGAPMAFGASEAGMPPWAAVAALAGDPGGGTPSVAVVWVRELKEGSTGGTGPVIEIREFGATTGLLMYSGVARPPGLMSNRDIELLAVMVVVVMLGILMAAVRPDSRVPPSLPAGYRVADPARRLMGTLIDGAFGVAASGWIYGIAPVAVVAEAMGRGGADDDLLPMLTAMGIAAGQAALLEWLTGASIGKLIIGARVGRLVRLEGAAPTDGSAEQFGFRRPTLWKAVARNLVKWGAPPVTVFAMTDPVGRHPGDLAAGTLVLVPPAPKPKP